MDFVSDKKFMLSLFNSAAIAGSAYYLHGKIGENSKDIDAHTDILDKCVNRLKKLDLVPEHISSLVKHIKKVNAENQENKRIINYLMQTISHQQQQIAELQHKQGISAPSPSRDRFNTFQRPFEGTSNDPRNNMEHSHTNMSHINEYRSHQMGHRREEEPSSLNLENKIMRDFDVVDQIPLEYVNNHKDRRYQRDNSNYKISGKQAIREEKITEAPDDIIFPPLDIDHTSNDELNLEDEDIEDALAERPKGAGNQVSGGKKSNGATKGSSEEKVIKDDLAADNNYFQDLGIEDYVK